MSTLFAASTASAPGASEADPAIPSAVAQPNPPAEDAVTGPRKRDIRAVEYRRLATAAGALAEASPLPHVREKHELAAARWTALAVLDEEPTLRPADFRPGSPA